MEQPNQQEPAKLSEDAKKKLDQMKSKLEKFKDELYKKFENYLIGVALLPPPKEGEQQNVDKNKINVLVVIDDSDSIRQNKQELKEKAERAVNKRAQKIDKNIAVQVLMQGEIWMSCYDQKYDVLQLMAVSAPVYDTGLLSAIKISEIHKNMVLKKFEKYIVSYVLTGSLVRGEATESSDIDVMVIIDDTDVKKMTRAELKDKLRAIIVGMGMEAGEMTGIRNKLNIQVYILTDFWDNLKEANPVIFTLLRDGVPFYDRGTFMPWKHLLQMGKIKPSQEAIDMFMSSGDQMIKRVEYKIKEIGMEDIYYSILTPSQAALMLYGIPPPAPRETARLMEEIFVKKEKMLESKYVKILMDTIQVRKDLEHGSMEKVSGKKIDQMMKNADSYLKRISKLFKQIQGSTEKEKVKQIYDDVLTLTRDALKTIGAKKTSEKNIVEEFKEKAVSSGEIPQKYLTILKEVVKAKKDFNQNKLSTSEVQKLSRKTGDYIRYMMEFIQRKRGAEVERAKVRIKHGEKYGELLMLKEEVYIIPNIDEQEKNVKKAKISAKGGLKEISDSSMDEMEKAVSKGKVAERFTIKENMLNDLKKFFGREIEIILN
ncbi:MAG: nucleotidyltransferase domain-containing protein [Candidatus Nanoarchaeia archaeon]